MCISSSRPDADGHYFTYGAEKAIDGHNDTAWRCDGDGVGKSLTISFQDEVTLTSIGMIPGFTKTDLEEDADVRDTALYHSVLAAVANGNETRGGIAGYIGRRAADIGHHLTVLEDRGLLRREPDVFRSGRSRYRVADLLINFYQVVMRPQWGLLESGRARPVWQAATARFSAQ